VLGADGVDLTAGGVVLDADGADLTAGGVLGADGADLLTAGGVLGAEGADLRVEGVRGANDGLLLGVCPPACVFPATCTTGHFANRDGSLAYVRVRTYHFLISPSNFAPMLHRPSHCCLSSSFSEKGTFR